MCHCPGQGKDIDHCCPATTQRFCAFCDCSPGSINVIDKEDGFPLQPFWDCYSKRSSDIRLTLLFAQLRLRDGWSHAVEEERVYWNLLDVANCPR
jgi:hypothetical protein